jgi:hypothetical protein
LEFERERFEHICGVLAMAFGASVWVLRGDTWMWKFVRFSFSIWWKACKDLNSLRRIWSILSFESLLDSTANYSKTWSPNNNKWPVKEKVYKKTNLDPAHSTSARWSYCSPIILWENFFGISSCIHLDGKICFHTSSSMHTISFFFILLMSWRYSWEFTLSSLQDILDIGSNTSHDETLDIPWSQ